MEMIRKKTIAAGRYRSLILPQNDNNNLRCVYEVTQFYS